MKAMKALLIAPILAVSAANAATSYNVTFNYETPAVAVVVGTPIQIPTSGGGTGTALLDDNGVLHMTLHGELLSDYTTFYKGVPSFANIIVDTEVLLNTTGNGIDTFYLVKAGSYTRFLNCEGGAQDTLNSCSFLYPGLTEAAYGPDYFYASQSFTLDGGNIRVTQNGHGIALTTNYTLTAVPLPASLWMFGSGVVGLLGWSRRQKV